MGKHRSGAADEKAQVAKGTTRKAYLVTNYLRQE
jgi:hypothetical protein